ncbi:uncharacterized protein GIQ15_02783 [Arthroderma uncinatum]|uniref:uncharacterized protein n=1 Tax=Arthroderma uncinatum TaxID=74035 RepID=UPI00144A7969|nr:uncharacterized protein GIQ15_02783 [Arthroderma uncinatum]KAF3483459.1 hypothetical protein GIQ15_02783 [Arthroderma uncinatum]
MTARIEKVLASKDPALTDENDWEEFTLNDVKVYIPGKTRYANILSASADNPLTVTGQLDDVDEEQESLEIYNWDTPPKCFLLADGTSGYPAVLDGDYLKKRVIIQNVTHYAYGQDGDGGVGVWAAGDAGWFSISPAKGYKPMFNDVVEAVDLLYFLVDQNKPRKRRGKNWKPTWDFLLDEYTRHTHGACEDVEESLEVFRKHHEFLIRQMVQGREGIDWPNTLVYAHLREEFPDAFDDAEQDSEDGDLHTDAADASGLRSADLEKSQANTIFEIILGMKDAGLLAQRKLNLKSVAEELLKRYEMSSLEHATNLVHSRAGSVLGLMDEAQSPSLDWSRKAIYRQLKEVAELEDLPPVGATPLQLRQDLDESDSASSPNSEPEEEEEEVPAKKNRKRRNRKSILRPKMSSVSEKAGKRNRDYASVDSDEDMEDIIVADDTPTKGGSLLMHEQLNMEVNNMPRLSNSERNEADQDAENDTSAISNGHIPPETWVCPVPGCGKRIPKATLKRSKEAIDDHNLVHADDTQSKVDLVFAEQRLNVNASVGNLLSRIRDFGGTALPDIMEDPNNLTTTNTKP